MAKRKTKEKTGPRMNEPHEFVVVSANKKALTKLEGDNGSEPRLEEMQLLSPEQFAGRESGKQHILQNNRKWSGSFYPYVFIRDIDSLRTPKANELRKRIKDEEKALKEFVKKTDSSNYKAKLITCRNCESKVNKSYVKDSTCPVCAASLRSKSTTSTIYSKEEKIRKLRRKLHEECAKHTSEAPLRYLVMVPVSE